jgi:hypothetical protein
LATAETGAHSQGGQQIVAHTIDFCFLLSPFPFLIVLSLAAPLNGIKIKLIIALCTPGGRELESTSHNYWGLVVQIIQLQEHLDNSTLDLLLPSGVPQTLPKSKLHKNWPLKQFPLTHLPKQLL